MDCSSCPRFKWDSGLDNFSTCEVALVKLVANKSSSCNLFGPPAIHFNVPLSQLFPARRKHVLR